MLKPFLLNKQDQKNGKTQIINSEMKEDTLPFLPEKYKEPLRND